jgi:hypothetical protein
LYSLSARVVLPQTSIEDLYQATKKTFNKSLVWQTPERPVLSAFKQQGCMLDVEKPATTTQMLKTLKQGGELIGMLSSAVTHDLRRGAATERAPPSRTSNLFNVDGDKSSDGIGIFCGCSGGSILSREQGINDS